MRAVTTWANRYDAFFDVAKGIHGVIDDLNANKQ